MKPRHIALVILVLMGVLPFISDVPGNITANLLQDQVGNYAWLILIPYSVIVGVLIGFELWDRPARRQDRRLAFDLPNRQAMIAKVRTLMTEFLRASLYHEVFITPDLTKRPKALVPPLGVLVQRRDSPDQQLPPGTSSVDVFDTSDHALLIMGNPGSGKTTLLLKLAQDLLGRAAMDPDHPIPVLFLLSSWATHQRTLAAWLADALKEQYYIPRKTGQVWVTRIRYYHYLTGSMKWRWSTVQRVSRQFTQFLIARAEGNLFFLDESVRALVETGVLEDTSGAYRLAKPLQGMQVPAAVQAVLAARIDRLPPEEERLLQTAAVIRTDVPLPLVQAIAEVLEVTLHRGLAHLQAEFLYGTRLFPEPEYTFTHALTPEVDYGSLLLERRRGLHACLVEVKQQYDPMNFCRLNQHIKPAL